MAMQSHILAIGKLHRRIEDCLELEKRYYIDAPRKTTVFSKLFCCTSTTMSVQMAKAFRVDYRDPATFKINPRRVREKALAKALEKRGFLFVEDWLIFQRLRDERFEFYFRPEP